MSETEGQILALNEIVKRLTVKAIEQQRILQQVHELTCDEDGLTSVSTRLHRINRIVRVALEEGKL